MDKKDVIEEYRVEVGAENVDPIIVLTGNYGEFEQFCQLTNRNTKTAIAVRSDYQLDLYPGLPIVLYGSYESNAAYGTREYQRRNEESVAAKVNRILGEK